MRRCLRLASIYFLSLNIAAAAGAPYVAKIDRWRQAFDADVRDGGWLAVVGRFKIDQGSWTVGSDPKSALVLPAKAPQQLGIITRDGLEVKLEPAPGTDISIGGKAVSGTIDLTMKRAKNRIMAGDLVLNARAVGEDFYLFVRDDTNPAIREFKGNSWFPINAAYRIRAKFEPYAHPESVRVPLTHVDSKQVLEATGDVVFSMGAKKVRLKTFMDDDELFVMFMDDTNGKDTYGGGRFLYAPKPKAGVTTLDFNKAFNPYCSLNTNIMCPIPPVENRLDLPITAGEMFRGE